jgi:hypothetical protein
MSLPVPYTMPSRFARAADAYIAVELRQDLGPDQLQSRMAPPIHGRRDTAKIPPPHSERWRLKESAKLAIRHESTHQNRGAVSLPGQSNRPNSDAIETADSGDGYPAEGGSGTPAWHKSPARNQA